MKFGEKALFHVTNFGQLSRDGARVPAGVTTPVGESFAFETGGLDRTEVVNTRLLQHTANLGHGCHKLPLVAIDNKVLPYHCLG